MAKVTQEMVDKAIGKKTLVVNLLGGPGTGKSSIRAGVFSELKFDGVDAEEAPEFAKDLTWEKRKIALSNQNYVFGEQHMRIFRNLGQVEVIITDSPLLLTAIYDTSEASHLRNQAITEYNKMWNYTVFLKRYKAYNPNGRNQTEEEAKEIDAKILDYLLDNEIAFETAKGTREGRDYIIRKVMMLLGKAAPKPTRKQIAEALEA